MPRRLTSRPSPATTTAATSRTRISPTRTSGNITGAAAAMPLAVEMRPLKSLWARWKPRLRAVPDVSATVFAPVSTTTRKACPSTVASVRKSPCALAGMATSSLVSGRTFAGGGVTLSAVDDDAAPATRFGAIFGTKTARAARKPQATTRRTNEADMNTRNSPGRNAGQESRKVPKERRRPRRAGALSGRLLNPFLLEPAGVEDKVLVGGGGGFVGSEEEDGAGHVGRFQRALQGLILHQARKCFRRRPQRFLALGHYPSGGESIDADIVATEIAGEAANEAIGARLGGDIDRDVAAADHPRCRGHVDDGTGARLFHVGDDRLDGEELMLEIHADTVVEIFRRHILEPVTLV